MTRENQISFYIQRTETDRHRFTTDPHSSIWPLVWQYMVIQGLMSTAESFSLTVTLLVGGRMEYRDIEVDLLNQKPTATLEMLGIVPGCVVTLKECASRMRYKFFLKLPSPTDLGGDWDVVYDDDPVLDEVEEDEDVVMEDEQDDVPLAKVVSPPMQRAILPSKMERLERLLNYRMMTEVPEDDLNEEVATPVAPSQASTQAAQAIEAPQNGHIMDDVSEDDVMEEVSKSNHKAQTQLVKSQPITQEVTGSTIQPVIHQPQALIPSKQNEPTPSSTDETPELIEDDQDLEDVDEEDQQILEVSDDDDEDEEDEDEGEDEDDDAFEEDFEDQEDNDDDEEEEEEEDYEDEDTESQTLGTKAASKSRLLKTKINGLYHCDFLNCDFKHSRWDDLKRHFNNEHDNRNIYFCPYEGCGFSGATVAMYEKHTLNEHDGVRLPRRDYEGHVKRVESSPAPVVKRGPGRPKKKGPGRPPKKQKVEEDLEEDDVDEDDVDDEEDTGDGRHSTARPGGWDCPYPTCGANFPGMYTTRDHYRSVHRVDGRYPCPFEGCDYINFAPKNVAHHYKVEHLGETSGFIVVTLKCPDLQPVTFSYAPKQKLGKMYRTYAEHQGIERSLIDFKYNGKRMAPQSTLYSLGVKDKDVIEVVYRKKKTPPPETTPTPQETLEETPEHTPSATPPPEAEMQIEQNEKSHYICNYPGCSQTFVSIHSCVVHRRNAHSGGAYKCPFEGCGMSFKKESYLQSHKVKEHREERLKLLEEKRRANNALATLKRAEEEEIVRFVIRDTTGKYGEKPYTMKMKTKLVKATQRFAEDRGFADRLGEFVFRYKGQEIGATTRALDLGFQGNEVIEMSVK